MSQAQLSLWQGVLMYESDSTMDHNLLHLRQCTTAILAFLSAIGLKLTCFLVSAIVQKNAVAVLYGKG